MSSRNWRWIALGPGLVLVVFALAVQAAPAGAQDFAGGDRDDVRAGGSSTTADDIITSTTPDELLQVSGNLANAHGHVCAVVGSANVDYGTDSDVGNRYIFGLRVDGSSVDLPEAVTEMELEFVGTPDFDIFNKSITVNHTFSVGPGDHIFRFNARKALSTNPNITVANSSMSVVCQQLPL